MKFGAPTGRRLGSVAEAPGGATEMEVIGPTAWVIALEGASRIDLASGRITRLSAGIGAPMAIVGDETVIWMAGKKGLARLHGTTGEVITRVSLPIRRFAGLALSNGVLWLVDAGVNEGSGPAAPDTVPPKLVGIDAFSGRRDFSIGLKTAPSHIEGAEDSHIEGAEDMVWLLSEKELSKLSLIDD